MKESYWIFNNNSRPVCAQCKVVARSEITTPYCPYCGAIMTNYRRTPCESYVIEYGRAVCYGTKEKEECGCGGDQRKCNFYEYIRRRATPNGEAI